MFESLLPLLLMGAAVWAWLESIQARDHAVIAGNRLCQQSGVQLLDQSVALSQLRLTRVHGRAAIRRRYRFEVSTNGSDRHRGHLDMVHRRVVDFSLPLPQAAADPASVVPAPRTLS